MAVYYPRHQRHCRGGSDQRRPIWALVGRRADRIDAERKMLVGLAHDRIIHLGMTYVQRGEITQDEYENLNDYLYAPYEKMGGNGSAKRVMEEVRRLPIRK